MMTSFQQSRLGLKSNVLKVKLSAGAVSQGANDNLSKHAGAVAIISLNVSPIEPEQIRRQLKKLLVDSHWSCQTLPAAQKICHKAQVATLLLQQLPEGMFACNQNQAIVKEGSRLCGKSLPCILSHCHHAFFRIVNAYLKVFFKERCKHIKKFMHLLRYLTFEV